jgi:triacylglycerol lipase
MYPILLAHGIARFDLLARAFDLLDGHEEEDGRCHYFRRIRRALGDEGFPAFHSDVPFAESVTSRARALRTNVLRVLADTGAPKLHIIAHSMGGLDARHMLYDFRDERLHERVASLTTIGTPHLGTSFADWGVEHSDELYGALACLGIRTLDGFQDLTRKRCREFDDQARRFEDSCGVRFRAFSGVQERSRVFGPLQFAWDRIHREEGENDGLVPRLSAEWRWPRRERPLDADHLNQVGWWDIRERAPSFEFERKTRDFYVEIARGL